MAKTKNDSIDLVAAPEAAGEGDLAAIDARIAELREEIERIVADRKRQLSALEVVRKSLQFRLHGRAPKVAKRPGAQGSELAKLIYDLIAENGPMPVPAIAARLNRSNQAIGVCAHKSSWFERQNGEVRIAVRK